MKKFIIYIFFIFVPFLFNSFANSSPFEEKFGKIIPIDTNFLFKPIILKCNKNSQEGQDGEKRFRGFVSSEYVWAYRNSGKFINLLFGYKTTKGGFKIEVLEKDIKMKYSRYYRFHDKNNTDPNKILSNSITGHKLRSNKKWYSCKLTIPKSNPRTIKRTQKEQINLKKYYLNLFKKIQETAISELTETSHKVNLFVNVEHGISKLEKNSLRISKQLKQKEDQAKKKAEELAKQKAIAAKKAKEDAARRDALAKKEAEELAKQKAIAAKKAKEDAARREALAKKEAEELAKQRALAAKKAEEEELKKKALNEKVQKIKEESQFTLETLKEYVKTNNKLDILVVSELLENFKSEKQKGWSSMAVAKYEALREYVQKDRGFVNFSRKKKRKELAAYNKEITQLREYLTNSQNELKAFITKNFGANNVKDALRLAKDTKNILNDFDVNKAISIKNQISTWKAMQGVKEKKIYNFKLIYKNSSLQNNKNSSKNTIKNAAREKALAKKKADELDKQKALAKKKAVAVKKAKDAKLADDARKRIKKVLKKPIPKDFVYLKLDDKILLPTRKQLISLIQYVPSCMKTIPKTKYDKLKPHMKKAQEDLKQSNQLTQMGMKKEAKDLYLLAIKRLKAILDKGRSYGGICIKWNAVVNGFLEDKKTITESGTSFQKTKDLAKRVIICRKALPRSVQQLLNKMAIAGARDLKKGANAAKKGNRSLAESYFSNARSLFNNYLGAGFNYSSNACKVSN